MAQSQQPPDENCVLIYRLVEYNQTFFTLIIIFSHRLSYFDIILFSENNRMMQKIKIVFSILFIERDFNTDRFSGTIICNLQPQQQATNGSTTHCKLRPGADSKSTSDLYEDKAEATETQL